MQGELATHVDTREPRDERRTKWRKRSREYIKEKEESPHLRLELLSTRAERAQKYCSLFTKEASIYPRGLSLPCQFASRTASPPFPIVYSRVVSSSDALSSGGGSRLRERERRGSSWECVGGRIASTPARNPLS